MTRLRVLVLTTLFPNNADPTYAPFSRLQVGALARLADVAVLGVVPWRFGHYYARGASTDVVREETVDAVRVRHPRYPTLPGLPGLNAGLMALAVAVPILSEIRRARPDVLLASYAYPDGCAGIMVGGLLGLPVVVKCHGSDLNRVPVHATARFQLQRLLKHARAVVVVSQTLGTRARSLGVPEDRIRVVYNGLDRERFRPLDRSAARRRLALPESRELILYLGHLAPHKGVLDLLEAARMLRTLRPTATTMFVGDGPLATQIQTLIRTEPVAAPPLLLFPTIPHEDVPWWMAAADVVCLPSWDEGLPNVVREALACGRPVVATDVGGIPEAVHSPQLGTLIPARSPRLLARALAEQLAATRLAPEDIVHLAHVETWEQSAQTLLAVLTEAARYP